MIDFRARPVSPCRCRDSGRWHVGRPARRPCRRNSCRPGTDPHTPAHRSVRGNQLGGRRNTHAAIDHSIVIHARAPTFTWHYHRSALDTASICTSFGIADPACSLPSRKIRPAPASPCYSTSIHRRAQGKARLNFSTFLQTSSVFAGERRALSNLFHDSHERRRGYLKTNHSLRMLPQDFHSTTQANVS